MNIPDRPDTLKVEIPAPRMTQMMDEWQWQCDMCISERLEQSKIYNVASSEGEAYKLLFYNIDFSGGG
jgi:hypothetical protein